MDFVKVNQKKKTLDSFADEDCSRPSTPSPLASQPSQSNSSMAPPTTHHRKNESCTLTDKTSSSSPNSPWFPSPQSKRSYPRSRAAVVRRDERRVVTNISEDMCITSHVIPATLLSVLLSFTCGGLTMQKQQIQIEEFQFSSPNNPQICVPRLRNVHPA